MDAFWGWPGIFILRPQNVEFSPGKQIRWAFVNLVLKLFIFHLAFNWLLFCIFVLLWIVVFACVVKRFEKVLF